MGFSSDTKPTQVPEGMEFKELDTQKLYFYYAGQWRGIIAGSGSWSPSATEILTNKTIVLNNNTIKTTLGGLGLFGFNATGEFTFIPAGSSNLFVKVNNAGTGFEFADPAVTGSWNPSGADNFANKVMPLETNTLRQATPHAGDIIVDNGTKFLPLAKGANNTYVGVNGSGVLGFYATSGIGGGGGGSGGGSTRPSQTGYKEGWWDGGTNSDKKIARGILDGEINLTYNNSPSIVYDNARGRYIKFPLLNSGENARVRVDTLMFKRNYSSYHLIKFRISQNVPFNFFTGFTSDTDDNFSDIGDLGDGVDCFMICKLQDNTNFQIGRNSGTSDATLTPLTSNPFNTDVHTIEIVADPSNNRFQYRIDDFPNGAWISETTNLPRIDIGMGMVSSCYTKTGTDYDFEIYDIEVANKLMV